MRTEYQRIPDTCRIGRSVDRDKSGLLQRLSAPDEVATVGVARSGSVGLDPRRPEHFSSVASGAGSATGNRSFHESERGTPEVGASGVFTPDGEIRAGVHPRLWRLPCGLSEAELLAAYAPIGGGS